MVKTNNKLAVLGICATVGLIGSAHANVVFEKVPQFSNINCEGVVRYETYVLKNNGGNVGIDDIEIEIEEGDSFANDHHLVKIVHGHDHDDQSGEDIETCVIGNNWQLDKDHKCKIVVEVNPHSLHCPSTGQLTGHIDRSLEIDLNGSQKDMYTPIQFDVTRLGSADGFALIGNKITNHHAGPANVYQNIACTDNHHEDNDHPHCIDQHNIQLNDGAKAYGPHDYQTYVAVEDMKSAYKTAHKLKTSHQCTYIHPELGGLHKPIASGTYCFKNPSPVVIRDHLRLTGEGEFVFIIDYPHTNDDQNALFVSPHVEYILEDGAQAKNVYWFVKASVETNPYSTFPGTIIATGNFESENYGTGTRIDGRVLLIPHEHDDSDQEPHHGDIELYGNTVTNPDSHNKD